MKNNINLFLLISLFYSNIIFSMTSEITPNTDKMVETERRLTNNPTKEVFKLVTGALLIYGLYDVNKNNTLHKIKTIAKGLGTAALGLLSFSGSSIILEDFLQHRSFSRLIPVTILTTLFGFATYKLGNSTLNDIKKWNKPS